MATVVNFIDTTLQAAASRTVNLPTAQILLTPSAPAFHVTTGGANSPDSITFNATLIDLEGTISFSCPDGTLSNETATSADLAYADLSGTSATVTASITVNGTTFTAPCTISKVQDGATGTTGATGATGATGPTGPSGTQAATAFLYQWSTTTPAAPTGTSTFTWATGENSAYTAADSWSVTAPSNPGTPGIRLYVAQVALSAAAGVTSTSVSYSAASISAWSQNGADGPSGVQSGAAIVYQWAATIPAGPSGSATYTWSSGAFGSAPTGWLLDAGTSPSPGYTLWAARVAVTDSASNTTTGFNWSSAAVMAVGYAGGDGASYVTAYCASTVGTGTSAPAPTTGKTSLPADNSGGITGTYSHDVPTLSAGYYQMQTDGIYDPSTDQITWSTPYQTALKVATLSAIVANLGDINAGNINLGSGKIVLSNDGSATLRSLTVIDDATGATILSAGGLQSGFEAPGTLNGDIVVGGRNLLPDSGFERGIHPLTEHTTLNALQTSVTSHGTYLGSKALYFDGTGADMYLYLGTSAPVQEGKTYVLSFYYQSAGAITGSSTYFRYADGTGNVGYVFFSLSALGNQTTWTRHVQLWTAPAGVVSIEPRFGITTSGFSWMAVDCIQIEEGNAATQWNPAPEDVDAGISTAQAAADTANAAIASISSDNVLSKGEKSQVIQAFNVVSSEGADIQAKADAVGVDRTDYDNAGFALQTYLQALSPAYSDPSTDTPIDGPTFRSKFSDYYTAKQALLNAIAAKAATLSTWAGTADRPYDVSNLVKKGTFEDGASGTWNGQGVENAVAGSPFSKEYVSHARDVFETDNAFDVTPGETLYFSAWLNTGATNYSGGFGVVIHDKAGTTILANTPCAIVAQIGWVYVEGSLVVPANGVNAQPWLFQNGTDFSAGNYLRAAGLWIGRHARGATIGADWASNLIGKPIDFRVVARGNSATSPVTDGLYKEGTFAYGSTRSYNVAIIRRSDAAFVEQQMFDVFNNGEVTGGRGAAEMAAMLNYYGPDCIAVVWTADEPQAHRLESGLDTALYRCGASRSVFGSPQFMYRSAYILVGICGCGEGNGVEAYQGAVNSDPNAWCDVAFSLLNGSIIGASGTYLPRTLADYSYTGDLDATAGATWGVNIGGSNLPADNATVGAPSGTNVGSTAATTVESNAANGQSAYDAVNNGTTGLAQRLRSNAQNILSGGAALTVGSLVTDGSGNRVSGYGLGLSAYGIAAYNSGGTPTITINASTGAVAVSGDISGSTGTFYGVHAGSLSAVTGNFYTLTIASGGYMRSANFSSGSAGFSFNADGSAELGVLSIRGAPTGPVSNTFNPCTTTETTLVTLASGTGLTGAHKVVITVTGEIHSQSGASGQCIMQLYRGSAAGSETTLVAQWYAQASTPNGSTWNSTTTYVSSTYEFSVAADSTRTGAGVYFKVTAVVGSTGGVTTSSYASVTISTNVKSATA